MTFDPFADLFAKGDAIVAELDQIHAADRARRADLMAQQRAIRAKLDQLTMADEDEETGIERPADRRDRDELRRRPVEERKPVVTLPERTTPGGPFGPKVRQRLIRVALGEERW